MTSVDSLPSGPGQTPSLTLLTRRLAHRVQTMLVRALLDHDLQPNHFMVLEMVAMRSGMNQSDLGVVLGIDRSTMVAVVDRLEGRALVRRTPSDLDRRSFAIEPTPAGVALREAVLAALSGPTADLLEPLSPHEQASFISMLTRVTDLSTDGS